MSAVFFYLSLCILLVYLHQQEDTRHYLDSRLGGHKERNLSTSIHRVGTTLMSSVHLAGLERDEIDFMRSEFYFTLCLLLPQKCLIILIPD